MRHKKLPYFSYIDFIYRHNTALLILMSLIIAALTFNIEDGLTHNDDELWMQGSKEYNRLQQENYDTTYIKKVTLNFSDSVFNVAAVQKLKELQKTLEDEPYVVKVDSFFTQKKAINNKISSSQELMQIVTLNDYKADEIFVHLTKNIENYLSFLSRDFKKVTFFVVSTKNINLHALMCDYPFTVEGMEPQGSYDNAIFFLILFIAILGSFTVAFKSILPSVLAAVFIAVTTLSTVGLFQIFSSVKDIHISIILVAITISVMDFVYVYYKWHVLQKKFCAKASLYRVLAKTIVPIFWTSVISIIAIGSLMFVDSHILYTIGLNVALSAFSGLFFSVTLLPVMLSFFSQKDPQIIMQNPAHFFAVKEANFKPWALKSVLVLSLVSLIYGIASYYAHPLTIETSEDNNEIQIALMQRGINYGTLSELHLMQEELKKEFPTIRSFQSAYNMIEKIYSVENPHEKFSLADVDIDSYLFSFDMYGVSESLIIDDRLTLTLFLGKNSNKSHILDFIRKKGFLVQDVNSLVYIAKMDSIVILFNVVIFVLLLIMAVIYNITRTIEFTLISLIVNIIPLSWFFAAIMFYEIPLSTEIFVAMIITVALSSDATLHFIYYYHQNRHKPRSAALALEQSFVYIGTPVGMGNLILLFTFALLVWMPNEIISRIGFFSTLLILLSLLVDLFILPVLFLHHLRNNKKVKDYFHG